MIKSNSSGNRYKKHLAVGPGGKRCACCAPAPGSKALRQELRTAKRRDHQEALAEGMAEVEEANVPTSPPPWKSRQSA